jgi:hypothetical protein
MESLVPQHRLLRLVHSMLHPLIDSHSDLVRPAHGLACLHSWSRTLILPVFRPLKKRELVVFESMFLFSGMDLWVYEKAR